MLAPHLQVPPGNSLGATISALRQICQFFGQGGQGDRVSFRALSFCKSRTVNPVTQSADVVVAGAGIIGLTTALELARSGLKVCVLERDAAARQASWAAGGILSPLPPDDPVPEIRDLLDESLALYPDYCAGLREQTGIDPEFWRCGATMTRANGERWLPELAQVRNPRLLQALIAALGREGVRLIEQAPVLGWQKENGRLTGVLSSQGVIHCKRAVLAAGAWSGGLAAILASTCCLGPLILVALGFSGAWIGNLTLLEPYRSIFISVALIALFFAWRRIFRPVQACQPGEVCAIPQVRKTYQLIFWVVAALVVVALVFPYVLPLFY